MQKILVCLKRVVDFNVRVRINPDGSGAMLDGVKMSINPFDEIALEEALRIRERGQADEIIVMQQGEMVEQASTQQFFLNPKQAYTQQLLDAVFGQVTVPTQSLQRHLY